MARLGSGSRGRANSGLELEDRDRMTVLYYLEALLTLVHLQRPTVIQNMTVNEWLLKTHETIHVDAEAVDATIIEVDVGSAEGPSQMAKVVLEGSEEMWFTTYFQKIRPFLLKTLNKGDAFFVTSEGGKRLISDDLTQFHKRFNLPAVTYQQARKAFEQCGLSHCNDEVKDLVKEYFSRSMEGEDVEGKIVKGAVMVKRIQRDWMPSTSGDPRTRQEAVPVEDKEMAFRRVQDAFPVGTDAKPPGLKTCRIFTTTHEAYCYKRWRQQQYVMRVNEVIGRFKRNTPTEEQVTSFCQTQGWTTNQPKMEDILESWKPNMDRGKTKEEMDLESHIALQDWKGLAIIEDRVANTGETVFTTLPFKKGEVVCDYHGPFIPSERGEELMSAMAEGKMIF
ncbi:uncharacterized protein LOC143927072 [Lithobates pipiens]